MSSSYRFAVSGRVQGVGFRASAQGRAAALGLRGWVRNRADGAVEGLACGEDAALAAFRAWLQRGPPAARVSAVEWSPASDDGQTGFLVRR
ncbi:MAG: acylphosphatase [Nevskia sp.]|nr:acylphosphatase [Nevskia sp.]